jgi:hypothetical protein
VGPSQEALKAKCYKKLFKQSTFTQNAIIAITTITTSSSIDHNSNYNNIEQAERQEAQIAPQTGTRINPTLNYSTTSLVPFTE